MIPVIWPLLLVLAAAEFARGAMVLTLMQSFAVDRLQIPVAAVGLAVSAHYLSDTLLKMPMGWLVDHVGGNRLIAAGLVAVATAVWLVQHHANADTVVAWMALLGAGLSPLWPAIISAGNRLTAEGERARMMSSIMGSWLVGIGAGPVVVSLLMSYNYRLAFACVYAALALAAGALAVAWGSHRFPSHPGGETTHPLVERLSGAWRLYVPMFGQTMAIGLLVPIFAPYAEHVLGLSHAGFGGLLVLGGSVTLAVMQVSGHLADRFGAYGLLVGGFVAVAVTLVAVTSVDTILDAAVAVVALGAEYGVVLPAWSGVLARTAGRRQAGLTMAVFMSVEGLGMAVGSALGGRLWGWFSPHAPFWAAAVILALLAVYYVIFRVGTKSWA